MSAPVALPSDASGLPAVVARASALLDDGDFNNARLLAGEIYKHAKSAAHVAKKLRAAEGLIQKAYRLQADALLIECQAKIRLADEYDAAQERGEASKGGRPKKTVSDENGFTSSEAGLTRKEIHEARKLRDAEKAEPGIAERAIEARLQQGLEPTKTVIRGIGTRSASKEERGDDFYRTPREAVLTLLALERFAEVIREDACGDGAISKVLEEAGHTVQLADLRDRGCTNRDGEIAAVADYLESCGSSTDCDKITNPPFNLVNQWAAHALREHRPRKMALLLNFNMMCGADNADRNFWMDEWPPARIIVFTRRLPMMHRDAYEGPKNGSQMNTAWFIWERQCQRRSVRASKRPYGDRTILVRADWKDFVDWEPEGGWL